MRLLVTRPEPDATTLKAHLVARGHDVFIEPLLDVDFDGCDPIEIDGIQALIATSKNGLRALARSPVFGAARRLRVYAVGPGTAATAKALGFASVVQGPKDGRELVPVIAEMAEVNGGPLLYLAGETTAYDVAGELRAFGFHVHHPIVYAVRPVSSLTEATATRMTAGGLDGIILLSPQTARIYAALVRKHGLEDACRRIMHFCLSQAVAAAIECPEEIPIKVAMLPNLQEMLALVGNATAD